MLLHSNKELVAELIHLGYLKTDRLIDAFYKVPREHFIPEEKRKMAYKNAPLPIGYEQTISQPLVVAFMLELLDPRPGEKILEIGTGSGWQTALLCSLLNGDESVKSRLVSLERIPQLKQKAEENLSAFSFSCPLRLEVADGAKGYLEEAPFDKIIAAATALTMPEEWKEQLVIGGKIVAPIQESIILLEKTGKKEFQEKCFFGFQFVPLLMGVEDMNGDS